MINWLKGLTLTITQWMLVSLLAAIGVLLVLLRLRTNELNQAQIDLIKAQFRFKLDQDEAKLKSVRERYEQALKEYHDSL